MPPTSPRASIASSSRSMARASVHDEIRRVRGGFDRIARGVMALHASSRRRGLIARSVVQRANADAVDETIAAAHRIGVDEMSFLAADVSSSAFNRPEPWPPPRAPRSRSSQNELAMLETAIDRAVQRPSRVVRERVRRRRPRFARSNRAVRSRAGRRRTISRWCSATRRGCRRSSSRATWCGPASSTPCTVRRARA